MKRLILFLFLCILFLVPKAQVPLTIQQAYNFDAGDTFDYFQYNTISTNTYGNIGPPSITYSGFVRNIIISKTIVNDSITYIISHQPYSLLSDTVLLTHIDSNLRDSQIIFFTSNQFLFPFVNIAHQSMWCGISDSAYLAGIVNWDSIDNDMQWQSLAPVAGYCRYQKGLGITYYHSTNNDGVDPIIDKYIELACYTKSGSHICSPIYPLGVNNPQNEVQAKIYPNKATSILTLSIANTTSPDIKFIITDISGQEVYSQLITQDESTHNISKLTTGLYTWRIIMSGSITIKTGKFIKE